MNSNEHIEIEDLASHVLLLLSPQEAALVREHAQGCPLCTAELLQVRHDLALYALAVEPTTLPDGARTRFLSRLEHGAGSTQAEESAALTSGPALVSRNPEQFDNNRMVRPETRTPETPVFREQFDSDQTVPVGSKTRKNPSRAWPWVAFVGWAAAAAILLIATGLRHDRDSLRTALAAETSQSTQLQLKAREALRTLGALGDRNAVRVNLTIPKAPKTPAARAIYQLRTGTLLLQASNLAPLRPQKVYELWIIPADGTKPVPAGTFTPDAGGNANLLVPSLTGAVAAKAFGITVENAGGSTSPTLPILLAGSPS